MESVIRYCCLLCVFGLSSMESVIRYCCLLCVFGLSCMKSVIRYCCSLCDLDCPLWSLSLDTGVYCLFWIVQHGVCHQVLLFVVCFGLSSMESVIRYCCLLCDLDCPVWSLSLDTVVYCVFWDCPAWSLSSGATVYCELWESSSSWGLTVRPYVPSLDQSQLLCQRIALI